MQIAAWNFGSFSELYFKTEGILWLPVLHYLKPRGDILSYRSYGFLSRRFLSSLQSTCVACNLWNEMISERVKRSKVKVWSMLSTQLFVLIKFLYIFYKKRIEWIVDLKTRLFLPPGFAGVTWINRWLWIKIVSLL